MCGNSIIKLQTGTVAGDGCQCSTCSILAGTTGSCQWALQQSLGCNSHPGATRSLQHTHTYIQSKYTCMHAHLIHHACIAMLHLGLTYLTLTLTLAPAGHHSTCGPCSHQRQSGAGLPRPPVGPQGKLPTGWPAWQVGQAKCIPAAAFT